MSTAITRHQEVGSALAPRTFDDVLRFADMLAKSDLVPKDYKGKPGNIVAAVQMGAELGLSPMQALANIAVINGRAAVWGDAMLALVHGHPDCDDVIETMAQANGWVATCTVKRRGRSDVTRTFSMEDAKLARLAGKQGPWTEYPKRMLQMRARAFALRDSFADVLRGIGMAEEVQDIPSTRVSVREPAPSSTAAPAALPPHDAATGEVIDEEIDPFDFVITFGKNKDKPLRELSNQQLHWYAEDYRGNDARVSRYARAVIDARKLERELEAEAAKVKSATDTNEGWGLESDAAEAEAEVINGAHELRFR